MHYDVSQDVDNVAGPDFAFAVLVRDGLRNISGSDEIEKFEPEALIVPSVAVPLHSPWDRSGLGHTGTLCGIRCNRSSQKNSAARYGCELSCS